MGGGNIVDRPFVDYREGTNVDGFFHLKGEYRRQGGITLLLGTLTHGQKKFFFSGGS